MDNKKLLQVKIVILICIALIVVIPLYQIFFNNQVTNKATTEIVYGLYANPDYGLKVNSFSMEITPQKQLVNLAFSLAYNSAGNYSILLTLPYELESFENLGNGTWYCRSTNSGSAIMVTYNINQSSQSSYTTETAKVLLHIKSPIIDKVFETSTISLPFGGSLTGEVQKEVSDLSQISPVNLIGDGINGTVRIAVPYSAIITGLTPQVERRDPEKDFQSLEFHITEFKPFQLQYVDSGQRIAFETNLLIVGVLFGIFGSLLVDILVEFLSAKLKSGKTERNNGDTSTTEENGPKSEKKEEPKDTETAKQKMDKLLLKFTESRKKEHFLSRIDGLYNALLTVAIFFTGLFISQYSSIAGNTLLSFPVICIIGATLTSFLIGLYGVINDLNAIRISAWTILISCLLWTGLIGVLVILTTALVGAFQISIPYLTGACAIAFIFVNFILTRTFRRWLERIFASRNLEITDSRKISFFRLTIINISAIFIVSISILISTVVFLKQLNFL
jgi:hypothetical protein